MCVCVCVCGVLSIKAADCDNNALTSLIADIMTLLHRQDSKEN